jgi:proteasome accessory factor C
VVWWQAHWYLVGHDLDRDDLRVFRTSRIDGPVRVVGPPGSFAVPEGFDPRAAIGQFATPEHTHIEVALAPGVGAALRRRATITATDPDGWDRATLPVEDVAAGVSAVLALGGGARVVGPAEAVAVARDQLEAVIAALSSPAPRAGRALPAPGARGPAGAQFSRLLALVPWLAANSGVSVAGAADHFGITEEQLRRDLGSVITSGADDWTLFDIQYWDEGGTIEVIDALDLAEPLTLTPDEAFALLVALHALDAVPGEHDRAALRSVMAALEGALGSDAPAPGAVSVRVDLPADVVDEIAAARAAGRALDLTYLGAVRDEITERTVDPVGVVVVDGYAYLRAHCRRAGGPRLFRLDRILDLRVSAETARPVADSPAEVEPMASLLAGSGQHVVVDVPEGSPVPERHPSVRRWALPDGGTRLEMPIGEYGWARRFVLGSAGTVALREPAWLVEQLLEMARMGRAAHLDA